MWLYSLSSLQVKIHDQELSDFASHIHKLIEISNEDNKITDETTYTRSLLPAPILTEEHLSLHHSQKLKLFSLMVLSIEPNVEISSIGFDADLSNKSLPILVERPKPGHVREKSTPTLINVFLKSNARDLIGIFLQTTESAYVKSQCDEYILRISGTQFYLKDTQIALHR